MMKKMMMNQLMIRRRSTKWSTILIAQPPERRLSHTAKCASSPVASAHPLFSVLAMRSILPVSATTTPVVTAMLFKVCHRTTMRMRMMTTAGPVTQPHRLPTPPMPRTTYAVVISDATTTKGIFAQLQAWWKNGTLLIALGWTALLTIVLDRYLQHQLLRQGSAFDSSSSSSSSLNKEEMIQELVTSTQQQRQLLYQQYSTAPALYQCRVIRYYKMGGSHGLYNVQLNDVVDILVEHVGPKQAYHLCRCLKLQRAAPNNASDNDDDHHHHPPPPHWSRMDPNDDGHAVVMELGWYPVTHLEKYTPPPKPRHWWQRLLFSQ